MSGTREVEGLEPPLSLELVLRKALATYRARFWRVAVPAVVIFVPLAVLDIYAEYAAEGYTDESGTGGVIVLVLSLAGLSGLLLGSVIYSGLLDSLVGAHHFGRPDTSVAEVLRALPYLSLIAANLLVTALVVAGFSLLVAPGLILLTLFGVCGPLIIIERHGALSALRHSARLVRPHFWLAFVAIVVPFVWETTIEDLMLSVWDSSLLFGILAAVGLSVVVGTTVGLIEVVLAHELIARDQDAA